MTSEIEEALNFEPKSIEETEAKMSLLQRYFIPEIIGHENIPTEKPTLFVGNHARYGFLDMPLIVKGIYMKTGVYPRTLSDRVHFSLPIWRDWIIDQGGVKGSREMCRALMEAGESILVYPGGAREVVKGRNKNYQLQWENRLGFVKMAAEAGYSITPFCSVGADDAFDVVLDGKDILESRLGKLMQRLAPEGMNIREDLMVPIPRGIGLTSIPRPEKFYFAFGKPIETAGNEANAADPKYLTRTQKKTAASIEKLLGETLLHRAKHRAEGPLWRRMLT